MRIIPFIFHGRYPSAPAGASAAGRYSRGLLFLCSDKAGFITAKINHDRRGMTRLMVYSGDHGRNYDGGIVLYSHNSPLKTTFSRTVFIRSSPFLFIEAAQDKAVSPRVCGRLTSITIRSIADGVLCLVFIEGSLSFIRATCIAAPPPGLKSALKAAAARGATPGVLQSPGCFLMSREFISAPLPVKPPGPFCCGNMR
jgi:hypothetical protein